MRRLTSLLACAGLSALVTACASGPPKPVSQAELDAHVADASKRFSMPEPWIREVIRQESGGRTTMNGKPIVSKAGAMGLMQLMPATYEEMRRKHGLGSDPFEPRDNIMAGTAYLREMYNLFGSPGFLGAYNCGPRCYGDYLAGNRSLPSETRNYIASIAPRLNNSPAPQPDSGEVMVASLPTPTPGPAPIAPAPIPPAPIPPALGGSAVSLAPLPTASVPRVVAEALPPPAPVPAPVPVRASAPAPAPVRSAPVVGGGVWTVQLGAFRSPDDGLRVIDKARRAAPGGMLVRAQQVVQPVDTQSGPLYRARLSGLSQEAAANACASLVGQGMACFVVAPGA
ncbi:transglycosylase SLT domain-containing protein [Azospirillum sp.]|uniref:transglycosylase SLT domain-containing protein n=1 Tax=Azospirillum sp. TaxID=34012 RepID=UPI003D708B20